MRLVSTSVLSMVLNATIELDVFEILAKAGRGAQLSPQKNASHIPDKNPDAPAVLDRMLRLQVSNSILIRSVIDGSRGDIQRYYGLAPVAKYFVQHEDGVSFHPLLTLIQDNDVEQVVQWIE
ncbi:caffeate O-methyltransferase [Olea europaea subsp. europaea]|uniref:Caffeate O-methyltransferase, partial n=1 Tax=Olea europaea subsp. europaea TaxID=158383 RepID=A0A8S0VEH0_OLEEU|nr:caffeate O-methyltransferase [Olea europaea subsp. europaea]